MSNAIKFKDPEDEKKLAKEWFDHNPEADGPARSSHDSPALRGRN